MNLEPQKTEDSQTLYPGVNVLYKPAPKAQRLFAVLLDTGIVVVGIYAALIFLGVFTAITAGISKIFQDQNSATNAWVGIFLIILFTLVILGLQSLYFIYYENKNGCTIGKKRFGLKVISADGSKLSLKQCILRELVRPIDMLIFPAFLCIMLTEKSQRLGDLLAGTIVCHSKSREKSQTFLYMDMNSYLYIEAKFGHPSLSKEAANSYMQYAYNRYLIVHPRFDDYRHTALTILNDSFPDKTKTEIDSNTLELYLAEYCNQHFH